MLVSALSNQSFEFFLYLTNKHLFSILWNPNERVSRLIMCLMSSSLWQKIQRAKRKRIDRSKRRIRDLRHKATTKAIDFCQENNVSKVFIGNPDGVRKKNTGRKHNQRLAGWEYGKDIEYLTYSPYAKQGGDTVKDFEKSIEPKNAAILNEIWRVFLVLLRFKRFVVSPPCFA